MISLSIQHTPRLRLERCFGVFVVLHVIAWTCIPFLTRYTLPMDAMEGAMWGQQLEFGYDKNPFLNGWLTALAVQLGGQSGWSVYLFSQLSVAICFWAVWELAKKMLPPMYALLAVLLLEGVQYYNVHAIDFNDNTLELGLWALTTLFFYQALHTATWRHWLATGCFAGLSMMTKYYSALLLLPMLLLLLVTAKGRQSFKQPAFYAAISVFIGIIFPHVVWLCSHDFVTIHYAIDRISITPTWLNHIDEPALFAWQQVEAFMPSLLLTLFLVLGEKPWRNQARFRLNPFDQRFLLWIGLGPFLFTLLLSVVTGIHLRAGWGTPLLSLWGIIWIAWLQPQVTAARFYRFLLVFFSLLVITLISYATALIRADEPSSANFPGKIIANQLTTVWRNTYHTPLSFVAGSRWVSGNVAFYSPDKPAVYVNWDKKLSPWINETALRRQGGIFIWDTAEDQNATIEAIRARFSALGSAQILHFSWLRNSKTAPISLLVAFLPPTEKVSQ